MAPLKFEEHIKDQFEERKISPSAESWGKLNAKLNEAEGKRSKKFNKNFGGAAASIMLLLGLIPLISNQGNVENNAVVSTNNSKIEAPKIEEILKNKELVEQTSIVSSKLNVTDNELLLKKDKKQSVTIVKLEKSKNSTEKTQQLVTVTKKEKPKNSVHADEEEQKPSFEKSIEQKAAALLAEIQQKESLNIEISETEIDELLQKAQWEITQSQFQHKKNIDAMALLNEVETELDENFKERVFDALKTSFYKLRTAVAERDN